MSTFHAYVDAAHFHEALGNVLRFAAKRSRLPILEEAQVRFEDGHCVLTCTNLDQWCMSTIPAVGDSFSFVFVGTRKILSACKYFSGELELTYTIEPTETNPDPRGQISISDGKRSLKRSTERTSDFPELKEKPLDRHYPVNPKRLLERFKRVKYAVSSNDARPNQCCIEFLKDKIIAVDGYRLALRRFAKLHPETQSMLEDLTGEDLNGDGVVAPDVTRTDAEATAVELDHVDESATVDQEDRE